MTDLLNDLAVKVDTYALASNVANARGILNVPGAGAQTYTSATPTVAGLYGALAQARTLVETTRFMSPTAILMHPRRWSWLLAASDTANRPLIVPSTGGATNAVGTMTADVNTVGQVGSLLGLPVYVDASMPLVGGQDQIVVFRPEDITLYESVPRAEAFRETYAPSLGIYLRVFEYVAIGSERYPRLSPSLAVPAWLRQRTPPDRLPARCLRAGGYILAMRA